MASRAKAATFTVIVASAPGHDSGRRKHNAGRTEAAKQRHPLIHSRSAPVSACAAWAALHEMAEVEALASLSSACAANDTAAQARILNELKSRCIGGKPPPPGLSPVHLVGSLGWRPSPLCTLARFQDCHAQSKKSCSAL